MKNVKVGDKVLVFVGGFTTSSGMRVAAHQVRGVVRAHHWVRPSDDESYIGGPAPDEFETNVSWSLSEWQDADAFTAEDVCGRAFQPDGEWAWIHHTEFNW